MSSRTSPLSDAEFHEFERAYDKYEFKSNEILTQGNAKSFTPLLRGLANLHFRSGRIHQLLVFSLGLNGTAVIGLGWKRFLSGVISGFETILDASSYLGY